MNRQYPPNFNHPLGPNFQDFINSFNMDQRRTGAGVDHVPGLEPPRDFQFGPVASGFGAGSGGFFPFGAPPAGFEGWGGLGDHHGSFGGRRGGRGGWGRRHGRHDRRGERDEDTENENEEEQMRDSDGAAPPSYEQEGAAAATATAEKGGNEKDGSPDTSTMRGEENTEDPPEEVPNPNEPGHPCPHSRRCGRGRCGSRGRGGGRGSFRGHPHHPHRPGHFGGPGGMPRGPHGPHGFPFGGRHHPPPPPPGPHGHPGLPFDPRGMIGAWANSPWAQQVREYVERVTNAASAARAAYAGRDDDDNNDRDYQGEEAFQPPVDIYNTETSWVIHVAVPGAKKEDTDVSWDADKSAVLISGLIYRPGNGEFLAGLITGERKVGLFNRTVNIPPEGGDGKEEADGTGVTAKMEDGLLIITVPKVEKEEQWTEIRKVDIE